MDTSPGRPPGLSDAAIDVLKSSPELAVTCIPQQCTAYINRVTVVKGMRHK